MNFVLAFLSHDWAGLVLAVLVGAFGMLCWRKARAKRSIWGAWFGGAWLGAAGLMTLGATYHLVHMASVRAQHPPPGKLVDVGGYRIHLLAEGVTQGKPTVVWIPGAHSAGFSLHHLHRALREQTRSVLVDRPGSGWSDIGSFPRTTVGEAEEVVKALAAAGEKAPFLLVGHSLGGLLVANIARRHLEIVAGVVLLDATPPDAINYAPPNPFLAQMRREAIGGVLQRLFGVHAETAAKLSGKTVDPANQRITNLIEQRLGPVVRDVQAVEDGARSMAASASIFAELAQGGMGWDNTVYDGDLGDLPVFLVAPGELQEFESVAKAMSAGDSAADPAALNAQRLHRFYLRARERYMAVSSRTQRIYAPKETGHNFPYEAPEFVTEVVRKILTDSALAQPSRSSAPAAGELLEFDLVLQSQVVIKAPPAVVWNYLGRLREWKRSVVSLERIAGDADQVGEELRIGQRPANQTVYVLQKTLQLERNHWKVQSLTTEDGRTTTGYVIYSLYDEPSGTRVVCDLVARARIPVQATQGKTAAQMSQIASQGTKAKLDADHLVLKQLIEHAGGV